MAAGVKPRSREAVRVFAQGFTRDDSPGEDGCGAEKTNPSRLPIGWGLQG